MNQPGTSSPTGSTTQADVTDAALRRDDTQWYKDAIIYQTHVKAFGDSNGDGIGDFCGLTERLDYIQQLGANTIWVLPFYPSPQRDDGYDIASYRAVHTDYGTMEDCQTFIDQAHERGLRVITELIINHTSDQHAWFQAARRAPKGSPERDFYVWSDDDTRYADARIIFTDTEISNWSWDPVAKQYYWHRFFSHQPDLNFDNPTVLQRVLEVMSFWLDMGVDGLRLDAIPYLIEREGTSCENLPETHAVLKQIRAALDERYPDCMLLAEANQWPEDVREYFGDGDECHMAYHFPVMPRMYMAVLQEDRFPIVDIMGQTPEIPSNCQWAIFLRNHDELTLEMVTDRERDYMYRTFAHDPRMRINVGIRRRLAPLLDNDMGKIKLMNSLLLSLLGTPVLYYGDEIGMGDNIYLGDRNGVRTPMQWSPDRNAGFSRADPQRLYLPPIMDPIFGYEAVNVEAQSRSPASLLNWMRRLIAVRKQHAAFGRGSLRFLGPGNRRILAYLREYHTHEGKHDIILCVANLSRSPQPVELNLAEFEGLVPVELTGRTRFPQIGALPYLLTLPGHEFYWFEMTQAGEEAPWHADHTLPAVLPLLVLSAGLDSLVVPPQAEQRNTAAGRLLEQLAGLLPEYLAPQRWFAAKNESITSVQIERSQIWQYEGGRWLLLWVHVEFDTLAAQSYFMPLTITWDDTADEMINTMRSSTLARVRRHARMGVLCDAFTDAAFCRALIGAMAVRTPADKASGDSAAGDRAAGDRAVGDRAEGQLRFSRTALFARSFGLQDDATDAELIELCRSLDVEIPSAQGSNTAVVLSHSAQVAGSAGEEEPQIGEAQDARAHRVFLKVYRRQHVGLNPELEIGRYLASSTEFNNGAPLAGGIEYSDADGNSCSLAVVQGHVANQGDAWSYTLGYLERFFEDHVARLARDSAVPSSAGAVDTAAPSGRDGEQAAQDESVHGEYHLLTRTLGQRTAELHRAFMAAPADDDAFAAEPVSSDDLRLWADATAQAVQASLDKLATQRDMLAADLQTDIDRLIESRARLVQLAGSVVPTLDAATAGKPANSQTLMKCRYHGDYHLGQVLVDRNDFIIIDFEGEPGRTLAERRHKQPPLKDVAGMLRSYDYAASSALQRALELWPEAGESFAPQVRLWQRQTESACLDAYRTAAGDCPLWPAHGGEELLNLFILDKALYELRYELDHRPGWVQVPLHGLLRLCEPSV